MTAPVPQPIEPFPYEQPPPEENNPYLSVVIAALVAYFASQAAISAALLPARLVEQLVSLGIAAKAARAAGKLALSVPMAGRSRYGAPVVSDTVDVSAARRVAADEPRMRAWYVYNAARRLTNHLVNGTFLEGLRAEQTYLQAHVQAGRNRLAAAKALDEVAEREGPLLRWQAVLDERTSMDCRALHGTVFTISNPPAIPGAVHPRCRCRAVGVRFD